MINGLNPGVALALFPIGTANVLSRELSIPRRPTRREVVLDGRTLNRPDWLGSRRFMVMAGISCRSGG